MDLFVGFILYRIFKWMIYTNVNLFIISINFIVNNDNSIANNYDMGL